MMLADHGGRTTFRAGVVLGDWGKYAGGIVVAGLLGFSPGSFGTGYLNFRLRRMVDNLNEWLSAPRSHQEYKS